MPGLLAEEADPALEGLQVDLGPRRRAVGRELLPAGDPPRRHHVLRRLHGEHPRELLALGAQVLGQALLHVLDERLVLLPGLGLLLVPQQVLVMVVLLKIPARA